MRRLTILFLLAALPVEAGPLNWAKHHKRFLLMEGVALGATIVQALGANHCYHAAEEPRESCGEHYGPKWSSIAIAGSVSVVAFPAIAEGCWKDNPNAKFCYVFAYAVPPIQTAAGINDFLNYRPKTK